MLRLLQHILTGVEQFLDDLQRGRQHNASAKTAFAAGTGAANASLRQITSRVLMVEPTCFHYEPSAALDNRFMHELVSSGDSDGKQITEEQVRKRAQDEYAALVAALKAKGVEIQSVAPKDSLDTPDAVFPNNWFSTHTAPEVKGAPQAGV